MGNIIDFNERSNRKQKENELAEFIEKFENAKMMTPEMQIQLMEWSKMIIGDEAVDIVKDVFNDPSRAVPLSPQSMTEIMNVVVETQINEVIPNINDFDLNWLEVFEYIGSIWKEIPNFGDILPEDPTQLIIKELPTSATQFYKLITNKEDSVRNSLLFAICLEKLFQFANILTDVIYHIHEIELRNFPLDKVMTSISEAAHHIGKNQLINPYEYDQVIPELIKMSLSTLNANLFNDFLEELNNEKSKNGG